MAAPLPRSYGRSAEGATASPCCGPLARGSRKGVPEGRDRAAAGDAARCVLPPALLALVAQDVEVVVRLVRDARDRADLAHVARAGRRGDAAERVQALDAGHLAELPLPRV